MKNCIACGFIVESDRILRPMILTKQLDLQGSDSIVSTSTPRGNLAKELEKYSRPELASIVHKLQEHQTSNSTSVSQPIVPKPPPKKDTSERPNILRRPSFKPKLSRSTSSSSESSISSSPANSTSASSNILSQQKLSSVQFTRSVTTITIPNPVMSSSGKSQVHGTVLTSSQHNSTVKSVYMTSTGQTVTLPPGYALVPQ